MMGQTQVGQNGAIGPEYSRDEDIGVWRRDGVSDIAYSDGLALEQRLLEAVSACEDVSVLSEQLPQHICDWPSEYHFSSLRANLLRPLSLDQGTHVLELGCGCGAMTRALGERGAKVVAVEGSLRRAAVAAARCRDLPQVSVVHDTITGFRTKSKFDFVSLIGVLEYAPLFFSGADPVKRCLEVAAGHLRASGRLLLAIENQLGLKYFAGCAEDHLSRRYFGIHDLYGPGKPVTFGRVELVRRLRAAGLEIDEVLYPFPDYKLPTVILNEHALHEPDLNVGDLLARLHSRDYGGDSVRAFDESQAWHVVARNSLVSDLANSFLIVARLPNAPPSSRSNWLAKTYSVNRRAIFSTETTIERTPNGLAVKKQRINGGRGNPQAIRETLTQSIDVAPVYEHGQLLQTGLNRVINEGLDLERVATWALPWLTFLQSHSSPRGSDPLSALVPGTFVDCVPFNLIQTEAGLTYIDAEWDWGEPIPLHWPLIRGLVHSLQNAWLPSRTAQLTRRQFVTEVLRHSGFTVLEEHFSAAIALEITLQRSVLLEGKQPLGLNLDIPVGGYVLAFESELATARVEIARIKSSASWQITKPLRLMISLLNGRFFRSRFRPKQ